MEWAEVTENIQMGCAGRCIYCWAANNANRFGKRPRAEWEREELTKRAEMKSYPARDGVIMFPSTHDITPFNVEAYCRVANLMLSKGNHLLIVSKPRPVCIRMVCDQLKKYKDQVLFRFTIGSTTDIVLKFWEPGAPSIWDRLESLKIAKDLGYRTSVSAEPLLGGYGTAKKIIEAVEPLVTDTIWIGKLNKGALRVFPRTPETLLALEDLESSQVDEQVLFMVRDFTGPKIRWKDSIKLVVAKAKT
jgi:DNA repair photolyase